MIYMQEMTVQIQRLFGTENKSFLQDYCTGKGEAVYNISVIPTWGFK